MKAAIPVYSVNGGQRSATGAGAGARGAALRPPAYGVDLVDRTPVQAWDGTRAHGEGDGAALHRAAQQGVSGTGGPLPYLPELQRAFGRHDVSQVVAHRDGLAASGAAALGTIAYARGEHVAFAGAPSLRVAAHEAAHVVQQRGGVQLPQGFGRADDAHERMADAVAERVVAGHSAEDLLDRAGARPGARADHGAPVQCYQRLPPKKLYAAMPNKRPWFGYPYAVVTAGDFVAQVERNGVGGSDQFLDAPGSNTAWTEAAGNGLGLRLSNDEKMAIEDSNLTTRQPKVFYATTDVVQASNQALNNVGSAFTLQVDNAKTVTVLSGWNTQKTLVQVSPQYNGGSPDQAPQNCNEIASTVVGGGGGGFLSNGGGYKAFKTAEKLAPTAAGVLADATKKKKKNVDFDALEEDVVKEYSRKGTGKDSKLATERANRYAAPGVGEGYMIATLGRGQDLGDGKARVRDYKSGVDHDVSWSYHFGGVVAQSGTDRITLENYARGDNRQANADPRWYFQMYGMAKNQSFHDQHKATGGYANALTVEVDRNT